MLNQVLIVNSSTSERALLCSQLRGDFDIIEVENSEAAIEILRESFKQLSAIFIAIDEETKELINKIKLSTYWRRIPVIVTAVDPENRRMEGAISAGANAYVVSPYDKSVLIPFIKNIISLCESAALSNTLHRDRLTGLYNRETFMLEAEKLVRAHEPGYYVMSSIDIENFKVINDQYGSIKGDEVLVHVANLLAKATSAMNSICCRVSADRFAMLYPRHDNKSDEIIEKFHADVCIPECIGRRISIRIGRYVVDDLSLSANSMYDRAGLAETSIKGQYNTYIAEYNEDMRKRLIHEQKIVGVMYHALQDGQFEIWYQPQYNHVTSSLIGAEALVRWRDPKDMTLIPPGEFIPVFERNGFIYELDKFVWEEACKSIRRRLDQGLSAVPISVNVSRQDVFHEDFLEIVTGLIKKYALPVDLLRLEITESAFANSADQIIDTVKKLTEFGFIVEIDDFGSGYSSLNTLKDVPATVLKMDLKFLENKDGSNSQRGGNIVESVVRMAKWLGMTVIAEGVETKEQADFLKSIGCRYVQGYYYGRPMPPGDFRRIMEKAETESKLALMETVANLDNNAFWDPKSMETLIFNSYVGGACIFEYHNGKTELLRVNYRYAQEFGLESINGLKLSELDPVQYLDGENQHRLFSAIHNAIEHGKESTCEVSMTGLDGDPKKVVFLQVSMRVIAHSSGHYLFYCVVSNKTAERKAEQKERETAERIRAIMENTKSGITAVVLHDDGSTEYVFINDRFYELLGYTREQYRMEVENAFDLIISQDYIKTISEARGLREVGQSGVLNMRVRRRDGTVVWLRCDIAVIRFDDIEQPVQLSNFTDITPEKEAEEQLRFLNESAHEILAQPDSEKAIEDTLKKILAYFGGDRAYVVELNYVNKSMENTYEAYSNERKAPKSEIQRKSFNETEFWYRGLMEKEYVIIGDNQKMLSGLRREGRLIGYVAIEKPFIGLSQPERLMALSDYIAVLLTRRDLVHQIKSLLDNLPCGAAMYEFDGKNINEIHINKRYWELVRRKPVEYKGKSVTDAVHPDDRVIMYQEISAAVRQERKARCDIRILSGDGFYYLYHVEATIMPKDECVYSLFVSYTPVDNDNNSFQEMLPIALSALMSASEDMVYVKDINSVYICGSQSMASVLGFNNPREIIGKSDYDLFEKDIADGFVADDKEIFNQARAVINYAEEIPDENGDIHYAKTSKFPLKDSSGNVVGLYGISHDVTKILETESQLKFLADSISGGLASFELNKNRLKLLFFNEAFYSMAGYSREEYLQLTEKDVYALLYDDDKQKLKAIFKELIDDNNDKNMGEFIYKRRNKDGGYRWMNLKCTASKVGRSKHILNIVQLDITEQKKNEEELRLREEEYRFATKHSGNTICRYNIEKQSITVSSEAAKKLALSEYIEGVPYDRVSKGFVSKDTADAYIAFYESIMRGEKECRVSFQKLMHDEWRWINAYSSTIFDNTGKPISAIISYVDVTEQLEKELESKVLAETDPLTGLLNRKAFIQRFELMQKNKDYNGIAALYMIDIDGFKSINDSFGHTVGDKALVELSKKLRLTFRSNDMIARLGGDEFIACISGNIDRTIIENKAEQICEIVRSSDEIKGGITISVGIAMYPDDGDSFEELYKNADSALYRVKESGKNHYAFYDGKTKNMGAQL